MNNGSYNGSNNSFYAALHRTVAREQACETFSMACVVYSRVKLVQLESTVRKSYRLLSYRKSISTTAVTHWLMHAHPPYPL